VPPSAGSFGTSRPPNALRPNHMKLTEFAQDRIVLLDGAMGTMIQRHALTEADYRGDRFSDWPSPLKGNNDLLCLTQPEIIVQVHLEYLRAGADLLETNTFNSNAISMADYGMEALVEELNRGAIECAQEAIRRYRNESQRPVFIVGSIGPTNRTASLSPDVENPGYRAVDFDGLEAIYAEQAKSLASAGADALMVETVFDTLNAKAALSGIRKVLDAQGLSLPIMVSGTITDASGRTLSGQTPEAFLISLQNHPLFSIGFNCALGADQLLPHVRSLRRHSPFRVSAHPNAGLPNALGGYDQGPEEMADLLEPYLEQNLVDILGGCCGTGPEHIRALRALLDRVAYPGQPIHAPAS